MKITSTVAAVVLWGLASPAAAADDAQLLLAQTAAAYAALQTYRDTGTASAGDDDDTVFATAFARPDRLRFAWTKTFWGSKRHSVLVTDGTRVTTSHGDDQGNGTARADASLAYGVAGATGVSLGAAHTVATLLLPHVWDADPFGTSVLTMTSPRLLDDDTIEGVRCRHVSGSTGRGDRLDVWIGAEDHLVRRVDTVLKGTVFRETHRDIRVDDTLPDTLFATARGDS